ncbi:hypothetical protein Mapa_016184 [Marchantia paleacea]|nr:hypothetical protein Mapa_016184 [Marchantia paleacea]
MALQLQTCADLRLDALHTFCKPVRGRRTRIWTTRRKAQADEGLSAIKAPPTGADIRASLTQRASNGTPSSSVAAPGHSRLLRRSRRHEAKLDAGDRITQIAEWVSRKVKDPLVEIDPVTVDKKIKAEEQMAREEQRAIEQEEFEAAESSSPPEGNTATVAPSTFDRPPPGFSRGMNTSPKAAAAAALVLATAGAAYLIFRSNTKGTDSKQTSGSLSASPVPAAIGGSRDVGTSRIINHSPGTTKESSPPQELHEQFLFSGDGDGSDQALSVRASVVLTSIQSQTITTVRPLPAFSGHQEETTLPSSPAVVASHEIVGIAGSRNGDLSFAVSPSDHEARPLEEVVAVNGVGLGSQSGQVADSEVEATEFQNALVFDKPQAAKELFPEDLRASSGEESIPTPAAGATAGFSSSGPEFVDDLAGISDAELPGADFQNAMVSDTSPMETSLFEVKPVDDDFAMETSTSQLVEDPVLFNLDNEAPALPVAKDVHIAGILNGAAAADSDLEPEEDRRRSYAEALQAVVPAIAVGAGAFSTLSGLDSGLEMVGLVATASFVAREIFMASSRQQLCGEVRKVKDHKSFLDFLKNREIIKDIPQE